MKQGMRIVGEDAEVWSKCGEALNRLIWTEDPVEKVLSDWAIGLSQADFRRSQHLLEQLQSQCAASEIKGHLRRSGTEIMLNSRDAGVLIDHAADALEKTKDKS